MHPIKKHIIQKLITQLELQYSKIKPNDIDPKLFTFHLKSLIDEDLIEKNKKGLYQLTNKGRLFTETLTSSNLKQRLQPKLATMIIVKNKADEYLLYKRQIEPFKDKVGFPWGKVHSGETFLEAAQRELQERVAIDSKLKPIGIVHIIIKNDGKLINQTIYHLYTSEKSVAINVKTLNHTCFWDKIYNINENEFIPGFNQIIKRVNSNKYDLFLEELTIDL